MSDALLKLAKEKDEAREAFERACLAESINVADFDKAKDRYMAALKAHHDALGYGSAAAIPASV